MELLHFKRLLNLHLLPWQEPKYQSFWNFYSLFKRQGFGVSEILGLPPVRAVGQIFQDQLAHLEGEAGRTREFGDEHDLISEVLGLVICYISKLCVYVLICLNEFKYT